MNHASVTIPTRNRKDWLRKAIESALAQTVPVEVIVMDDGSTDGTPEMMKVDFPQIGYHHFGNGPHGPTFLRNRGAELAQSEILFPIDDDAVFVSPHTVEQTLKEFDDPRVGIVAIPFINVRIGDTVLQKSPDVNQVYLLHAFYGAAHAVRRSAFLAVKGYREELFYMGEEGDLSIRMLNRGYFVRVGNADLMHHHESPKRVNARAAKFGRQNDILFVLYNVPLPAAIVHLLATTWNGLRFLVRPSSRSDAHWHLLGLIRGYFLGFFRLLRNRRPVRKNAYRLFRYLKANEPVPLREIEQRLPRLIAG